MVNKKKMSRIFQMFTSPSKTVEDNESDGQEEVTASTRPYVRLMLPWMKLLRDPDGIPQILHKMN